MGARTQMNAGLEPDGWPWPDVLDALIAAPRHHRLLFENEQVRVLDVRIAPGDFVPVHTHRWPSVVHILNPSDFIRRDGEGEVLFDSRTVQPPVAPKPAIWLVPLPPHSVENVGNAEIRLFTVELKNPTV
jgi:predicted metal-dependent enzyme (double-stranded beta helix superfamily)